MKTKIKYRWTGEYRLPKAGEWYLESIDAPIGARIAGDDMSTSFCRWILRREEVREEVEVDENEDD